MKQFFLFSISTILSLATCFSSCRNSGATDLSEKPNIIVLFADDLGWGDLGCYGHPTIRTPHLDKMAENGIRFTSFYMASSVCSPSRAALLTGKYPSNAGINRVLNNKSKTGLSPEELTIAEGLKTVGYSTAIIGKWHLGHLPEYLPTKQGFDYWFGVPYSNDNNGISAPENEYLSGPPLPLYENESIIEHGISMGTITKRYTEKAIEYIRKEKDNPFFLYLPYTMPHVPIDASEKFKGKSEAGLFGDVIEELDWSVGQILQELEKLGIAENTMVIFTSDNGPMIHMNIPRYDPNLIKLWHHGSAGPLRGGKFEVYEGGFRVPGIIQWKGKIKAGQVTSEVMRSIDLKPTIFKLAGVTKHDLAEIDGVNQHSLIFEQGKSATDELLYERNGQKRAFRKGDWKIVLTPQENNKPLIELFNLKNDVQELYNIAGEYPEKEKELINLINDLRKHNTGC